MSHARSHAFANNQRPPDGDSPGGLLGETAGPSGPAPRRGLTRRNIITTAVAAAIFITIAAIAPAQGSPGQTVTSADAGGYTADDLARNLIGDKTPFSGAKFTGSAKAIGLFDGFGSIGMDKGVVLSTGLVSNTPATPANNLSTGSSIPGPNKDTRTGFSFGTAGDADLDAALQAIVPGSRPTKDGISLEFDFVPKSPHLTFKFIFASEEYQEFVGSPFNDVFALLVNGRNCALVGAAKDPIAVNTVNHITNTAFYQDNPANTGTLDTGFDGLTKVMTCDVDVNKGVTNHVKFAIADVNDTVYDSGVFIQAGSFVTEMVDLTGKIYNDANSDGVLQATESGIAGQTVAVYDSTGKFVSETVTDASGSYKISVPIGDTYYVRPVQIKAPLSDGTMMSAVQTYARVSAANPTVVKCRPTDVTSTAGAPCNGAKSPANPDPAANPGGAVADWLTYATVQADTTNATATDFGFSSQGSYGDAVAGPGTIASGAPGHVNGVTADVWLGATVGKYAIPATNGTAHNATDDGVYIDSAVTKIPLEGTILAATKSYPIAGDLSGTAAASAKVKGWVTGPDDNVWNTAAVWNPVVAAGKATGSFQYATSPPTGTPVVQFRANASTVDILQPTNAAGEYYSAARSATPGEIEDYSFKVAEAVYRPAAVTSGDTATFTVAGQSLTANATVKVGAAVAAVSGTAVSLTASAPDATWRVQSVTVKDTVTNAVIATLPFTVAGLTASFSYTPTTGSDVMIVVAFDNAGPSAKESELTLDKDTTQINTNITATVTVRDAAHNPMAGQEVKFSSSDPKVTLSANTCMTTAAGSCWIHVTSSVIGDYPNVLHATVREGAVDAEVTGSPRTLHFTPGTFSPEKSTFTVDPVVTFADKTNWIVANGVAHYTGTLTAKDDGDNPIKNLDVAKIVFSTTSTWITVSAPVVNHGDGTYTVTFTSTHALDATTAKVAYDAMPVVDPVTGVTVTRPVPFKAGPPTPTCTDPTRSGSTLTATPDSLIVGGTSHLKAYITDEFCNPVEGAPVAFSLLPGSAATLTVVNPVTDAAGNAYANVTDDTAETVQAAAKIDFGTPAVPTDITGSPVKITFNSNGFDPYKSTFTVDPVANFADKATWVVADGTSHYTGTLTARDFGNNLLKNLDVAKVVFRTTSADITISSPVVNHGDGTYTVTFTSLKQLTSPTARVAYDGQSVVDGGGTPVQRPVPFKAGGPSTTCSQLTANPTTLVVGGTSHLKAYICDANGNPVEGEPVTFALLPGSSGVLTIVNGTTDAAGNAYANLTNDVAEPVQASAKINTGTPAALTDITGSPVTVTFTSDGFDPYKSTFTVSPVAVFADETTWVTANGTSYYTGTLTARDFGNNLLKNLDVAKVNFTATSAAITISAVVNNGDGTYTTHFSSTTKLTSTTARVAYDGQWVVDAGGTPVLRPVPFKSSGPNLTCSTLTANPSSLEVHKVSTITAYICDGSGNALPGVDVTFALVGTSSATLTIVNATTDAAGNAVARVTDDKAEVVQVSAKIAYGSPPVPTDLTGSPVSVTFTPGPLSYTNSSFDVQPKPDLNNRLTWVEADGVHFYKAILTAKDDYNNPITNLNLADIEFTSSSLLIHISSPIVNNGDGTYEVHYTSTTVMWNATASVKYKGIQVGAASMILFG